MQGLRPYFSFSGRATRLSYWRNSFFASLLIAVPLIVSMALVSLLGRAAGVLMIFAVPLVVVVLAVYVRRLHDRNKSAWWLLPFFVAPMMLSAWIESRPNSEDPVVLLVSAASLALSVWALIDLGFLRGTDGPNRYGPDPLKPTPADVFS